MQGSNLRPLACKASALPAELILQCDLNYYHSDKIDLLFFCLAASYSCRGKAPTTIGAGELNFCVRHGNRCDLSAVATRLYLSVKSGTRHIICILRKKCKGF